MMRRLLSLFLVFVIVFTSTLVRAQDVPLPVVLPEVPEAVLTPMQKDDMAPYRGVLLSPDAIANIIADYKAFEERLRIELQRAEGEAAAQKKFELENLSATCDADKKIITASFENEKRENKLLVDRQKDLEKKNKNVLTWTLLGAGVGALVGALGFYGVSRLTE